jgi:VanZ family protein
MARCVGLSAAIEFIQLWLPNRSSSLADLAANAIGVLLGILLWLIVDPWTRQVLEGLIEEHIREPRQDPRRGNVVLVMLSIYGAMLAALSGWFTHRMVGWAEALARLRSLHLLPLYYHQQASIFVAVPSAIVVACAYFPVGLLRFVVGRSGKPLPVASDVGMAALWAAGIAALVEVSKLFLDGKRADSGNILIAMLAAAIGYLLAPSLLRRFARSPAA